MAHEFLCIENGENGVIVKRLGAMTAPPARSARAISSAAMAAPAACASSSASSLSGEGNLLKLRQALFFAKDLYEKDPDR